jgi:ferritin-like metal-binding protein YciE
VSETSTHLVRRYLEYAIVAEKDFEVQLRGLAETGDDAEVQAAFLAHAEETRIQCDTLADRLQTLGGPASGVKSFLAGVADLVPKTSSLGDGQEARVAQNLITAFAIESAECAMYEALGSVAAAAADPVTERLARDIQAQSSATADQLWRFIPTRSKIAFNVLTAGEIDPAIETKAPDNRVI